MTSGTPCESWRERISGLVMGALAEDAAEETREHLQQCQGCAAFHGELSAEEAAIQSEFARIGTKAADVTDGLIDRLDREPPSIAEPLKPELPGEVVSVVQLANLHERVFAMMRTNRAVIAALAFLGVCGLLVWMFGANGGAQEALAAAIEGVKRARTVSCTRILESTRNGKTKVMKEVLMFKEPHHERHEWLVGVSPSFIGEVEITDYGKRRRLRYLPVDKTAYLNDTTHEYVVDPGTGKLEQSQLKMWLRDKLLAMRKRAVNDLGNVELDGRSVRLLESRQKERVTRVWIDPKTDLPVQIEIQLPTSRWVYASIRIDEELDDKLFSLEVPDGYRLPSGGLSRATPEDDAKLITKMMHVMRMCAIYAVQHDDQFPKELTDLKEVGVSEEVLKTLLAAPGRADGPPVIGYRPPRPDVDPSKDVILYEIFEQWPGDGAWVGLADCHCEHIGKQEQFEELMR